MDWPYGNERADVAMRRADPYMAFMGVELVESILPPHGAASGHQLNPPGPYRLLHTMLRATSASYWYHELTTNSDWIVSTFRARRVSWTSDALRACAWPLDPVPCVQVTIGAMGRTFVCIAAGAEEET